MNTIPKEKLEQEEGITDIFDRDAGDSAVTINISGKSHSGKTYFLVEQLNKLVGRTRGGGGPYDKRPIYDKIIMFTESLSAEPLKGLNDALEVTFIYGYVPEIVRLLKQINDASKNSFRFLVILDDVVTGIRAGTFAKQILTMRNAQINTVFLIQYSKIVSPAVRNSVHHYYITGFKPEEWEYLISSFLKSHVIETIGRHKPNYELTDKWIKYVGSDIVHYNQRVDRLTLVKRDLGKDNELISGRK